MKRLKKLFTSKPKIASVFEIDYLYDNADDIRTVYEKIEPKIIDFLDRNDYVIIAENKSVLNRSFTIAKVSNILGYREIGIIELYRYILYVDDGVYNKQLFTPKN